MAKKSTASKKQKSFEQTLWETADKLRGTVESSEYKHVVLSLIFLKFISDKFEQRKQELIDEGKGDYADMVEFYTMKNVFYLPEESRWAFIQKQAKQDDIAVRVDTALHTVEKNNKSLRGALPDNYFSRLGLDPSKLAALIDSINNIDTIADNEQDVVGRVYEYFLGKFAATEGKGGGEFYTPKCVVNLIAEMIEPFQGKIYDPCCGSGGMFVQSVKFVESHQGSKKDISIYGQEYTATTYKLAKMNLAIRGIAGNLGDVPADTFFKDQHPDLKADFIMANPPFNLKAWRGADELTDDPRWAGYEVPPTGNANYAWILHMLSKLSQNGVAGFVLANGSMSTNTTGEGLIRRKIIENDLVDCMIALPGQLFYTTQIPVCLWFIARNKSAQPSPRPSPKGRGSQYRGGFEFSGLVETARELRGKQTPAEEMFWELVRNRKFLGLKFRRQHQIGSYVTDFYCHEQRLVVELDGGIHDTRKEKDQKRDRYLESQGLRVLRIKNEELLDSPQTCLETIAQNLPSPPGRGAGGEGKQYLRNRQGEVLFIDARNMGTMLDRTHKHLTSEDIAEIARTYHAWRGEDPPRPLGEGRGEGIGYADIPGFCKAATLDEIKANDYVLTPGRYVGAAEIEDDGIPFEEKMTELIQTLYRQMDEAQKLDAAIRKNLEVLGYGR
jgi:type I restriction enzyme M protein